MPGLPHSLHALVTGGGRGIGREIASVLTQAGATVTVLGRDRATLDDAVARGATHFAAVADVADQAAVNAAVAQAAARQPIDILIANAGIAESAPFAKSDAALFRRMMDVNSWAWFTPFRRCCRRCASAVTAALSRSPRRLG